MPLADFNYYLELEVDPSACEEVIKAARGALAKLYHTDTNHDVDGERMKRINVAYECLKDSEKRSEYDLQLAAGRGAGGKKRGGDGATESGRPGSRSQRTEQSRTGPLRCEKCGRTFKSAKGWAWHRENFTWCATSRRG